MNIKTVEFCKKEIHDLLDEKLIKKVNLPIHVLLSMFKKKNVEIERGTPRFVINYRPLKRSIRMD